MKKFSMFLMLAGLILFLGAGNSFAVPMDITVYDGASTYNWYGPQEDNETEPSTNKGQEWDLEAFLFDDDPGPYSPVLSMVGGYNFAAGEGGYASGDIFIDVDGDAIYGAGTYGGYGNGSVLNSFGWDYAINLDFTSNSWIAYDIDESTYVDTVYFSQTQVSNPWQLTAGQSLTTADSGLLYMTDYLGTEYDGYLGNNTHYIVSLFNLDEIEGLGEGTTFKYTYECGNDNLVGRIPEPATILLLGFGLVGLGVFGSKRYIK